MTDVYAPTTDPARTDLFADGAMTVKQAVAFTGLGKTSVYQLMERGDLAYTVVGSRRLIPRKALVALPADNARVR